MLNVRHKIGKKGYTFRGTVEEGEVRDFCNEENVAYNDFIKARPSIETLYKYPQLFDVSDNG